MVDWILKRTVDDEDGIDWMCKSRLPELAYADDIVLLSENTDSMKRRTEKLAREASKFGLLINQTETKVMAVQASKYVSIALEGEVVGRL